jgi:hypothetical protein
VRKLNDASVEVILGLAQVLGEKHGKTDEWWAEYRSKHPSILSSIIPATTTEALVERIQQRVSVFREQAPEEDETWESWYLAAFDMLSAEITTIMSRAAPLPTGNVGEAVDEVTEDEIRGRAKDIIRRNGWLEQKAPPQLHSIIELMVSLGLDVLKNRPASCGYPGCGCDHDAVCNVALAAPPKPVAAGVVEAATELVDFAWSAVVTDCTESAEYLNELVEKLRAALAAASQRSGE